MAAARLAHPAVVALYEAGQGDDGDWILVCELVRGPTLQVLMRDGALSDRDAAEIGVALCDALEHAHGRGVVHRDLKPANVICPDATDEAGAVAKLTDFGVARLAGDDTLTRTGDVLGTLAYMAPEQARGRAAGPPADVYALGIVLYEALAGMNPRRGANAAESARLVDQDVPSLGRVRRDLPEELCDIIDRAVAVDPRRRPKPASLRAALKRAIPDLDDEPGVIAGGPMETVTHVLRAGTRFARDVTQVAHGRRQPDPALPVPAAGVDPRDVAPRRAPALPTRIGAAVLAGLLAAGALAWADPAGVPAPMLLALGSAVLVLLLPRLGWLATAAGIVGAVAVREPGTAILLAAMLAPVPILVPRAGTSWSVPVLAPLLGLAGLAGAYCALAGQARRATVRAGLGALGAWWVLARGRAARRAAASRRRHGRTLVRVGAGGRGRAVRGRLQRRDRARRRVGGGGRPATRARARLERGSRHRGRHRLGRGHGCGDGRPRHGARPPEPARPHRRGDRGGGRGSRRPCRGGSPGVTPDYDPQP